MTVNHVLLGIICLVIASLLLLCLINMIGDYEDLGILSPVIVLMGIMTGSGVILLVFV